MARTAASEVALVLPVAGVDRALDAELALRLGYICTGEWHIFGDATRRDVPAMRCNCAKRHRRPAPPPAPPPAKQPPPGWRPAREKPAYRAEACDRRRRRDAGEGLYVLETERAVSPGEARQMDGIPERVGRQVVGWLFPHETAARAARGDRR